MQEKTRRKWKRLIGLHEKSGLGVKEFCKKAGVHYSQFYRQYQALRGGSFGEKAELFRKLKTSSKAKAAPELFMELKPEVKAVPCSGNSFLKITYHEMTFELASDFNAETFRKALSVIREAL